MEIINALLLITDIFHLFSYFNEIRTVLASSWNFFSLSFNCKSYAKCYWPYILQSHYWYHSGNQIYVYDLSAHWGLRRLRLRRPRRFKKPRSRGRFPSTMSASSNMSLALPWRLSPSPSHRAFRTTHCSAFLFCHPSRFSIYYTSIIPPCCLQQTNAKGKRNTGSDFCWPGIARDGNGPT